MMTEAEWRESTRPLEMLEHLLAGGAKIHERFGDRPFRRFACTCLRRVESRLSDRRSRQALLTAERYTEGTADRRAMTRAHRAAEETAAGYWQDMLLGQRGAEEGLAARAAAEVAGPEGYHAALAVCQTWHRLAPAPVYSVNPSEVLREFFGNPFRTPELPAGWRQFHRGLIVQLSSDIHAQERWADLPVLADALEEAGCTDADVLEHCRTVGGHRRGCWVLELLRGE